MKMLCPHSLLQVFNQVKLQKWYLEAMSRKNKTAMAPKPSTSKPTSSSPPNSPFQKNNSPETLTIKEPFPPQKPYSKELKRLCYKCHEKFVSGQSCKVKQLHAVEMHSSDSDQEDTFGTASDEELAPVDFENSLLFHALSGLSSTNTIRIQGRASKVILEIHIDSESTSNFVDDSVS